MSVKIHQNQENPFGWILVILALVTFNLTCSSFVPWTTAASDKWRHDTRFDFGKEIGIYPLQTLHSNEGWLLMHRNTLMGLYSNWYTNKLNYKEGASPVGKYCSGVADNSWLYILLTACCCEKIRDKSWQSNCHMRPLPFSTITITLSRTSCLDFVGLADLVKRLKNKAEGHQLDSWLQN